MLHRGIVKPCPLGPAPPVWPVKLVEVEWLAEDKKLVRREEKQRKDSLRCSSPKYFVPFSLAFSPDTGG